MGIFRTIGSVFNRRMLIEETIKKQASVYENSIANNPDLSMHDHLATVWLSRMATFGRNPNDPVEIAAAYAQTALFACIPSPSCIRALAISMLRKENEGVLADNLEIENEMETLLGPVFKALENETTFEALYLKYNPVPGQMGLLILSKFKSGQEYTHTDEILHVDTKQDGRKHTQGTYTLADGGKYVGEYKDGKFHGQGTHILPSGAEYVGEFKDGIRHGQGTYTFVNGDKYVGEFKDSKQHGQGTYTWVNGDKYVGEWNDDKRHGQGTLTWPDGTVESGRWEHGEYVET